MRQATIDDAVLSGAIESAQTIKEAALLTLLERAEKVEKMMDGYIHLRRTARNVFKTRHQDTIAPDRNR
jgi:hypothetical protein